MSDRPMTDPVLAVLRYDPALRCACTPRLFDQCIRQATGEDGLCNPCREMRAKHGMKNHRIGFVTETAMRAALDQTPLFDAPDAHYVLITEGAVDLAWGMADEFVQASLRRLANE